MPIKTLTALVLAGALTTGCATSQSYPTAKPLTQHERDTLNCVQIDHELSVLTDARGDIQNKDKNTPKTIFYKISDLGVGNYLDKMSALEHIEKREQQLFHLKKQRAC